MEIKRYLSDAMLSKWHELVDGAGKIVVLGHAGPDGDAMGAILAMTHYLKGLGKQVVPMTPNPCPDFLQWLPGEETVVFAKNSPESARQKLSDADLVMCLDFSGYERLEDLGADVEILPVPKIVIDHHLNPMTDVALLVSDPEASATCEIIFCVLDQLGAYESMDYNTACCLYCGLMTDTGAFAYNSNRADLFVVIAKLIAKGIDKDQIYRNVYYSYSESRLRLMGYLMNEKLIYMPEEHAAIYSLTSEEMERYHFIRGDAEGFVNLPLQIKGTKLSISLREDTEKPIIRVSLRSVGDFPCNEMSARFFNGGGHKNASGGTLPKPMSEAIETVRKAIAYYRNELI